MQLTVPRPLVRANQGTIVAVVALSALLRQPSLLGVLFVVLGAGLILGPGANLIMRVARPLLRGRLPGAVQEDAAQQRFNQTLACVLLGAALICFHLLHSALWGWLFAVMVGTAAGVALLGFCIGCWLHMRILVLRHHFRRNAA